VPRNVQIEFNRKHRSRHLLNKLFQGGVLWKCTAKDETSFQLLIHDLDPGEAECLIQAQEKAAEFFLVDERKARAISLRRGLTPYGTVRLIARLSLEGYAEDTWTLVQRLRRERGFHVTNQVVDQAIAFARMPIGRSVDPEEKA
jgi:predicted nucleic acid-binding protein